MKLTEETFLSYAMHSYDNPQCVTLEEFEEDLKRFIWVKKMLIRYKNGGELCERIILNHLIIIFNVFGDAATKMLFFRMDETLWSSLVTFLIYLKRMPDRLPEIGVDIIDFTLDAVIIDRLRAL